MHQSFLQLALASAAVAKPLLPRDTYKSTSGAITWGSCDFNGTLPIVCGSLEVPLDYTSSASNKSIKLDLVKVTAANTPSKGSILFNFGGPGYPARESLASSASDLQNKTGGDFDLIAFDPRGTASALPFSCFTDATQRQLAAGSYPVPPGDGNEYALGQLWASSSVLSTFCAENGKDVAEYIGTSFVARDTMKVVDALGEDGLLRFWGFSYGSLLGATIAAMFPDRMDKIILDGVVNGHNYFHKTGIDVDQLKASDNTFTAALGQCVKAADRCPLSQLGSTASEIQAALLTLANEIKASPIAVNKTIIDYNFVLNLYYVAIKYPVLLPATASLILNIATKQNLESVITLYNAIRGTISLGNPDSIFGIKGGDTIPRYPDLAGVLPDIEHMKQTSPMFWGIGSFYNTLMAQWPFKAKEVYTGDFRAKTKTPILFIGNTWDPSTPLASALNMSASFDGSIVLEQHGFGHTSLAQKSSCTSKIIGDYFANGNLPQPSTVCEVDEELFPASTASS